MILETAERHPGQVTLVGLGPLTNIATAALADPARFARLAGIVIMGGAFLVPGNMTPVAEFNIFSDPHAARVVLSSGVPVTFVGLDVTTKVCLRRDLLFETTAPVRDPVRFFVQQAALHFLDSSRSYGCHLHDPLTIGFVIDPSLVKRAAELAGYDVLLTVDQGMPQQQRGGSRMLAIILIRARTNQMEDLLPLVDAILDALQSIKPGQIVRISELA